MFPSCSSPFGVRGSRRLVGLPLTGLGHVASADPPTVRIISDNPIYAPYERSAEKVTFVGRIRWFAREM